LHLADLDDITIFPIKTEHLLIYENLPLLHRDPFDRLLVATAIAEEMTLITDDKEIVKYGVPQIW
jgi:PIN domain nuclease of toxin-antitoxin system